VVTICTDCFNIKEALYFPTQCINVFHIIIIRTNSSLILYTASSGVACVMNSGRFSMRQEEYMNISFTSCSTRIRLRT